MCKEASKVKNEDVSYSIKTRDANTKSNAQPSFNHGVINNNLNVETIFNQFKKLIVKAQDVQASFYKFINITSHKDLTMPGFLDITDVHNETVGKKGTVLLTGDSILSGWRQSKMSKQRLLKVCYFPGARITHKKIHIKKLTRRFCTLELMTQHSIVLLKLWRKLENLNNIF